MRISPAPGQTECQSRAQDRRYYEANLRRHDWSSRKDLDIKIGAGLAKMRHTIDADGAIWNRYAPLALRVAAPLPREKPLFSVVEALCGWLALVAVVMLVGRM